MEEVIKRAIKSIDKILESLRMFNKHAEEKPDYKNLRATLSHLDKLLGCDLSGTNDSIELFCRRLKRLLDYNDKLPPHFWIELYDDINYVLYSSNCIQDNDDIKKEWVKNIDLERQLTERELSFKQKFVTRKGFYQLFCEHEEFYRKYLDKCISFHSKIQVLGLAENIDDLLCKVFHLRGVSLTAENQKKLNCIEIPFDCSNRSLDSLDHTFFTSDDSYATINNSSSYFLPSVEQKKLCRNGSFKVESVLQSKQWFVILGDPGNAKTTLLRWLTRVFSEAAYLGDEKNVLQKQYSSEIHIPTRIPVLIRIGELASWFEKNKKKTLMDYVGKHTWNSQSYCDDKYKDVLKELIYHGHALILLDGLDEIPDAGMRGGIVNLIKDFINQYVRTIDFVSPFDESTFGNSSSVTLNRKIFKEYLECATGGNQIIITSRIIGYQLHPITGPHMEHYLLSPMSYSEAEQLVHQWMGQVEQAVRNVLKEETVELDNKVMIRLREKICQVTRVMFESTSKLSLCNYLLMSMICTSSFKSSVEFNPKSRVEIYDHAVRSAIHSWTNQYSSISKDILTNLLIELAIYLHLQSPSGLIDAFDMKNFVCLILQQQHLSNNRLDLREYASDLMVLLGSDIGIIAERGLQVFGFLHLSFQEYFVAQALVKDTCIGMIVKGTCVEMIVKGTRVEMIVKRMFGFIANPRFRESFLLAIAWISWKWSLDEYDQFCNLLITSTKNYAIPVGTLLLFDAFKDTVRLPSKPIIFLALNSLLQHPFHALTRKYLVPNLSKLPKNIIQEWVGLYLDNEECLLKFCRCLKTTLENPHGFLFFGNDQEFYLMICQQLWLFHRIHSSLKIFIDQTRRKAIKLANASNDFFNERLSSDFLSCDLRASDYYHPLIFSVIIGIWGGVYLKRIENIWKIRFLPKHDDHTSLLFIPIKEYFDSINSFCQEKMRTLIEAYESILKNFRSEDISIEVIDTFIAFICLQGLSNLSIYQEYSHYYALPLALNRFKCIWFNLKQSDGGISISGVQTDENFMQTQIRSTIEMLFSHSYQSNKQRLLFLLACAAAFRKLGYEDSSDWCDFTSLRDTKIVKYLECQPEFLSPSLSNIRYEMEKRVKFLNNPEEPLFVLLMCVPQSLQPLYYCMMRLPICEIDSLILLVLLSQRLKEFYKNPTFDVFRQLLQELFKEHQLNNYSSVCDYWSNQSSAKETETSIDAEFQYVDHLKDELSKEEKDVRLFLASISFAHLYAQDESGLRKLKKIEKSSFSDTVSKMYSTIKNIDSSALKVIALGTILNMKHCFIFGERKRNEMRQEMVDLLQNLLPDLSLMTSTLLFVEFHKILRESTTLLQQITHMIDENWNETGRDQPNLYLWTVFIALKELNNSNLLQKLWEFAKRTVNMSDLLQFNSTILFPYVASTTETELTNSVFLSSMYLTELTFDAQVLNTYTENDRSIECSPGRKLIRLLHPWQIHFNVLTYEGANGITSFLEKPNSKELCEIIKQVSNCTKIEKEVISELGGWIHYQDNENKNLKFFALYAALQMIIEGADDLHLIGIINQIFDIDNEFRLKSVVERLIESPSASLSVISKLFLKLNENFLYSSQIFIEIHREDVLVLILKLELDQIVSITDQSSRSPSRSFLLMIKSSLQNLQLCLKKYLHEFVYAENGIELVRKEEYLTIVMQWIIKGMVWDSEGNSCVETLQTYIFNLLDNRQIPWVQKAILSGFNATFSTTNIPRNLDFVQDDTINHLETLICSCDNNSEEVLPMCLLVYSHCLSVSQRRRIPRKVPNEVQKCLETLWEESSSEIISIRAAFCFIFQAFNKKRIDVFKRFEIATNITAEMKYKILFELILYDDVDSLTNKIVQDIQNHSSELITIFIDDLYNRFCSNYLYESTHTYVTIALILGQQTSSAFLNAVKKRSFGEEGLKRKLYQYFCHVCNQNKITNNIALIRLYASFGVLTSELVKMLGWIAETDENKAWHYPQNIREVLDRSATEELFTLLKSMAQKRKLHSFSNLLSLIIQLAQAGIISAFEVHQNISPIINDILAKDEDRRWYNEYEILKHFLTLTCIQNGPSWNSETELLSEGDIYQRFKSELQAVKSDSTWFLRRNYLLYIFE